MEALKVLGREADAAALFGGAVITGPGNRGRHSKSGENLNNTLKKKAR